GDDGAIRVNDVDSGVHVLGNYNLDNRDDVVVRTVGGAVRALVERGADEPALVAELQSLLARRGEGWPCVSLPGYGTRSAGVLVWRATSPRFTTTERAPDV